MTVYVTTPGQRAPAVLLTALDRLVSKFRSEAFRQAVKVGLAMVTAYYISLSMGWDRPHWAGLAVALCSLDTVGDSLNKGLLRILGTFMAGAVALLLAALFPQDRWGYLLSATLYVAFCAYMTGHSSRWYFWFIAGYVMALLALAGGPEGVTLFEDVVLRVLQTSMGVAVYTTVAVVLWPRQKTPALLQTVSSIVEIQRELLRHYLDSLVHGNEADVGNAKLRGQAAAKLAHLPSVVDGAALDSFEAWETRHLWRQCTAKIGALNEAIERLRFELPDLAKLDVVRFLPVLAELGAELDKRSAAAERMLAGAPPEHRPLPMPIELDQEAIAGLSHVDRAALIRARDQLHRIDELTIELFAIIADICNFGVQVRPDHTAPMPAPVWIIDRDRLTYATRTFTAVWIILFACIYVPGFPMPAGVIPVAAAVAIQLAVLPQKPVRTVIVPCLASFAFAGAFHVFVMPHLHGFVGLGAGIFVAIFLICFAFSKPEQAMNRSIGTSMFVMIILVENQQSYSFLFVVNFTVMFLLALGAVWISGWFPISLRPQDVIFRQMRRFLTSCERLVSPLGGDVQRNRLRMPVALHLHEVRTLPGRIEGWMAALPTAALGQSTHEDAHALVNSLQELGDGVRALIEAREARQSETLRRALTADVRPWHLAIQEILRRLAASPASAAEANLRSRLEAKIAAIEVRIERVITAAPEGSVSSEEIEQLYRLLGAYRRVSEALVEVAGRAAGVDWAHLREERF